MLYLPLMLDALNNIKTITCIFILFQFSPEDMTNANDLIEKAINKNRTQVGKDLKSMFTSFFLIFKFLFSFKFRQFDRFLQKEFEVNRVRFRVPVLPTSCKTLYQKLETKLEFSANFLTCNCKCQ